MITEIISVLVAFFSLIAAIFAAKYASKTVRIAEKSVQTSEKGILIAEKSVQTSEKAYVAGLLFEMHKLYLSAEMHDAFRSTWREYKNILGKFTISEESLNNLKKDLPDDVLEKLRNIKDQTYVGRKKYLNILKEKIGIELLGNNVENNDQIKLILKNTSISVTDANEGKLIDIESAKNLVNSFQTDSNLVDIEKAIHSAFWFWENLAILVVEGIIPEKIALKFFGSPAILGFLSPLNEAFKMVYQDSDSDERRMQKLYDRWQKIKNHSQ